MAGQKRKREIARAKYERQTARRQEAAARRKRINQIIGAVVVVLVVAGISLWAVKTFGGSNSVNPTPSPTVDPTDVPTNSPSPTGTSSPSPTSKVCNPAPSPRTNNMTWPSAPAMTIKTTSMYSLNLSTNCGDITIQTTPAQAPQTVNSMVFLANQGYFDLTTCHRLTTEGIYVLQCGDPTGTGTGGPGYTTPDENLPEKKDNNYPAGTVAMANSGPGTDGSQFFLVYKDTTLPPNYTIWGTITSGLDVIQKIAAEGSTPAGDGAPNVPVTIEKATVTTS